MPAWLSPRPLKWRPLWLVIGWLLVGLVVYLSLAPQLPQVDIRNFDKVGHFLAYFALMSWFAFIYARNAHLWIGVMLVIMGIALEIGQYLTGYRAFEIADIVVNTLGVMAGMLLARTRFAGLLILFERRLDAPEG